jgi:archaellum biogenesis ATPase FlaH
MELAATLTDFWDKQYLEEYIAKGGSKIKFITGSSGSGKSACLHRIAKRAQALGYKSVQLSAKETWLHDFKEIYAAILKNIDLDECLKQCAKSVITQMGFAPEDIPEGLTFAEFLTREGLYDAMTRREMRTQLNSLFIQNPRINRNFAVCVSFLTGVQLGYPSLDLSETEQYNAWLSAESKLRITGFRKIGLAPFRIDKSNARHMLRSLVEVIRLAGYQGLVIGIDDVEILANRSSLEQIRYSKLKREDAYESVRELIDEIDTLRHTMFLFAFDSELTQNETAGLKSYQALWMRIQNEIHGKRLNRFADLIDLDLYEPGAPAADENTDGYERGEVNG